MSNKAEDKNNILSNQLNPDPQNKDLNKPKVTSQINDIISQLKTKLYDLQQRKKDYNLLKNSYKKLLKMFSMVNEEKLHLEYEIKQKDSEYTFNFSNLSGQKEHLKINIKDKIIKSKKLFSENDLLEREIDLKNDEINALNNKLSQLSSQFDQCQKNKTQLSKMVKSLNDEISNQNEKIYKMKQDNICLTKICQDYDFDSKYMENDINKLKYQLDEINYDKDNINKKVLYYDNNLKDLQKKLDESENNNIKLQNDIKILEKNFDLLRNENDLLKKNLSNEKNLINEKMAENEKLNEVLFDEDKNIDKIKYDKNNIELLKEEDLEKKKNYQIENNKLKETIKLLEKKNKYIINEVDNILTQDKIIKNILSRKSRINSILQNNNTCLEKSINNLEDYLNKSNSLNEEKLTYEIVDRSYN